MASYTPGTYEGAARGYGRARVRQMLYEKGIGRDLWDEALAGRYRKTGSKPSP